MEIEIENFEKLKESQYRKGFGTELNGELEEKMKEGNPEFSIEKYVTVGEDEMAYRLNYRKDNEKDWYYFNSIDAALLKSPELAGEVREHSFPTDQLTTATEMHRMLKYGTLVSVNKTLFNKEDQQYNTWLSIDVSGPKNEYGNYPTSSYHENYFKKTPFVIADQLNKLVVPVKELEDPQKRENIEKALKKANLPMVTMLYEGKETIAYLSVNPKERRIDVLDSFKRLVQNVPQKMEEKNVGEQASQTQQTADDLKKKPGQHQQQRVNWTKDNKQGAKPSR